MSIKEVALKTKYKNYLILGGQKEYPDWKAEYLSNKKSKK